MSKIALEGNASGTGTFTVAAPNSNSNYTLTLPTASGTLASTGGQPSFASTIGVGGATPAASGAGVSFPATQSASSDANTLDDYEEGTWTPVLTGDGGGSGQSYTAQAGTYSKIGRIVTVSFYIQLSAKGTITGNAIINNLPFTVINSGSNIMGGALSLWSNLAVNHYVLGGYCNSNTTNFYFWGSTAAAATPPLLTTTDIENTTRFWGSVTYLTNT